MHHPEWARKSYNNGSETHILMRMAEKAFESLTISPVSMKLRGGPILAEVKKNIEALRKSRETSAGTLPVPQKIYLYSGHDTTVTTLLQALGVYETHLVPYTAAVFVELHKKQEGDLLGASSCDSGMSGAIFGDDYYLKV